MEATLSPGNHLAAPNTARVSRDDARRRGEQDRSGVADQNRKIEGDVAREESRLRRFIRRRVGDEGDADEILQEVFYELVAAYRLMKPIEEVTAWLFEVARNRIIDLGRKKKAVPFADLAAPDDGEAPAASFEDLWPLPDAGPEAEYARGVLLEELEEAIDELPEDQREAFVGHEIEGRSFKELASESGASVNALVLRKHYAVEHLRKRLAAIHAEFAEP